MAAVFMEVAARIIAAEKGYVNRSDDLGGETKYGISKRQYPHLDIPSLTIEQALTILKRDYWDKYQLSTLNSQNTANQLFFLLVNMNPFNAIKIVQKAINVCGGTVLVDGLLGSKTVQAINSLDSGWLGDRIRVEAGIYYLRLSDKIKSQAVNFRGWMRRILYEGSSEIT